MHVLPIGKMPYILMGIETYHQTSFRLWQCANLHQTAYILQYALKELRLQYIGLTTVSYMLLPYHT